MADGGKTMRTLQPYLGIVALVGFVAAAVGADPKDALKTEARVVLDGTSIQLHQQGAFLNIAVTDPNDDRRITRIETQPLADNFCVAIVAELRHGSTDQYSYVLIVARAPRNSAHVRRESKTFELAVKGPKFDKMTLQNPESDTMKIRLDSPQEAGVKPITYRNGCARAWLTL
jgi:hypothetical protein